MVEVELDALCTLAEEAGARILEIYGGPIEAEEKADRSPLTAADRASHRVIEEGLRKRWPDLPVLSEEGREIPYDVRRGWRRYFLVDPLDGTKEFLKRNGEFTVNIALIEDGAPALGVVHAPVLGRTYFGGAGLGAWRRDGGEAPQQIRAREADPKRGLAVVQSRSHPSPELEEYLKAFTVAEAVSVGSSLKFCVVAEGRADLYPRLGPTMEWDTAAGQAVLEGAGGTVADLSGLRLRYNKEDLRNGHFVARGREKGGVAGARATNVVWHAGAVTREDRERLNGHRGAVLWFTGLSGSGKSSVAHEVERRLHERGVRTYVLDGDNVRHGLNRNLGFSPEDREENIRRVAEVAKLLLDAGIVVLVSFISPYRADREQARALVPPGRFFEIYVKCGIAVCEQRDPKGLYRRARAGEIADFTGISAPYEEPLDPELLLETDKEALSHCAERVVRLTSESIQPVEAP